MLFFSIVFLIAAVLILIYTWINEGFSMGGIFLSLGMGLLISLVAILISQIISAVVINCDIVEYTPVEQTHIELMALKDHNTSYYLRRGYANDRLNYIYLYEDDKGIATDTILATQSYINYIKDGENPYLIKTYYNFKNPILHFFLIDSLIDTEYSVFVPEGTISAEGTYEIDLE